LWYNAPTV